ncbi:MAG TPA: hypothetical protein PL103_07880 [Saccharofermentans sp.]|nr:hypothetical protein [Saccharofermentans sp.]
MPLVAVYKRVFIIGIATFQQHTVALLIKPLDESIIAISPYKRRLTVSIWSRLSSDESNFTVFAQRKH